MTAVMALRDGPWSLERLVDELACQLMVYDDYYDQALALMYRIPVTSPSPTFKVKLSHLSDRINIELHRCTKRGLAYILKEASGRVFENVDYRYFHGSVKRRLVVELIE